jgi:hypothetical protein
MIEFKYRVHLLEITESEQKKINIIWQGNDEIMAWDRFFTWSEHFLKISKAVITELVEREPAGTLVIRARVNADARPMGGDLYGASVKDFGFGMYIPKMEEQQKIIICQDVLYAYDRYASTCDITIAEEQRGLRIKSWLDWLQQIYLPSIGVRIFKK